MEELIQFDEEEVYDPYEDRSYQVEGTNFLWNTRRAFLTDEFGLGKTPQAIKATELPCQVFAPKYLIGQWADAIRREHGDAVIALADGTRKQRDKILSKRADWYITNIEMAKSYDMPTGIRTYINDESHHLRNRTADKTKAVYLLENIDPTTRIYNLTATPFWKTVDDIWMQARILYPTVPVFKSHKLFVNLYCVSINGPYGPKILGIRKHMRADLKALLSPIMLGRSYKDVGRYLPEVIENIVRIPMPSAYRAIYDKLVAEYQLTWQDENEQRKLIFQPTTVLHALRQVTFNSGKVEAVLGILEDNLKRPAVIGCWYRDHAAQIYEKIKKDAVLITGDVDAVQRQKLAMWAQNNGKHIVCTQDSLKEGVNLYKYRLFIAVEEHYIPGSNEQFLRRVVRDRNDKGMDRTPVRAYYVQVAKSLDLTIHRIARKRQTTNNATRELLEKTFGKSA